jgi:hypothetical protein
LARCDNLESVFEFFCEHVDLVAVLEPPRSFAQDVLGDEREADAALLQPDRS